MSNIDRYLSRRSRGANLSFMTCAESYYVVWCLLWVKALDPHKVLRIVLHLFPHAVCRPPGPFMNTLPPQPGWPQLRRRPARRPGGRLPCISDPCIPVASVRSLKNGKRPARFFGRNFTWGLSRDRGANRSPRRVC